MTTKRFLLPIVGVLAAAVLAGVGGWLTFNNTADAQSTPAAPGNVMAVDGTDAGEAVVSWDAADGAAGYSVRWLNVDAARVIYEAGGPWENAIQSVDVGASSDELTVNGLTLGTAYSFQVGSKSGPDADPNWSGWVRLTPAGEGGPTDIYSVAQIQSAALAISDRASELAAIGSVATHGGMNEMSIRAGLAGISAHKTDLDAQLAILEGMANQDRVDYIEMQVNRLVVNVTEIQRGRGQLLRALQAENNSRTKLVEANTGELFPATDASVDRQFYKLAADADSITEDDLLRYTHTSSLATGVTLGHTLLLIASLTQSPTYVARIQETYDSVAARVERDVEYLEDDGNALGPEILALAENVSNARAPDEMIDYFDRLVARLELVAKERDLIEQNVETLDQLQAQLDALSAESQGLSAPPVPTMEEVDPGDPGITDSAILFGQSAALSGSNKDLGEGMQRGIEAAFKEANDAGGVHGRQLTLNTVDDGYEPDDAFANTLKLIEDDEVFALIGAVGTPTSRAALPLAQVDNVPFVGALTGAQLLRTDDLTNVLNFRASYHEETARMMEFLAARGDVTGDVTKVAVLYQNDSYGVDGLTGVQNAVMEHEGIDLVASWYYLRNSSAIESAAFRISEAEPDAVIIVGTHAPAAAVIKKLRMKLNPDPIFLAVSFVGSNELAKALGDDMEGVYVTQVVPLPTGDDVEVLGEYRAALAAYDADAEPGFISLEGYLAGRLAIERLQACGDDVSRECFLDVSGDAGSIDIGGIALQFGENDNQGSDSVFLTRINADGEFRQVDSIE